MASASTELAIVRYIVDDVTAAIDFYTTHLRFTLGHNAAPAFADVVRGRLRVPLSGPTSSGRPPHARRRHTNPWRLEPHPPHRRRHRRRGRPPACRGRDLPQRHRQWTRRPTDPARGPRGQLRRVPMLSGLPAEQAAAVKMVDFDARTHTAAAGEAGISVSGRKSRVQRGRAALKAQLHACCQISQDRTGHVHDYRPRDGACGGDTGCGCGATSPSDQ
ncbi:sigma factor-like helix-turn-helix DNA-binding protein [Nocardia pseudovaccinii]|uniref:sigma factor-like helix-turn-helix DNA-binding protein n=1 Tax=Nocardia pseudovaccinii TaxID=189540 RepID=UPI003D92A272